MAYDPALVLEDRVGESGRSERAAAMDAMRRDREVYGFITDVTEIDEEGWYGNPGWATADRAAGFAATVAAAIVSRVQSIFALRP